ncbi:MAG: TonB family protein [Myxococcota bacterium]
MILFGIALAGAQEGAATAPEQPAEGELPPLVAEPQLLKFVEAPYPEAAKAARVEGKVLLAIEIDEAGKVRDVQVVRGVGHGLDEAAVAAAQGFEFSPAMDAAGPVPVIIEFEYGFVLEAEPVPVAEEEKPVTLEGQLLEMGTRRPLAGFVVRIEPEGVEVTTGEDGRWSARGIGPGEHTLRVVRPGYDALARTVAVAEGEVTSARLWLRSQDYEDVGIVGTYREETPDVSRRTISIEEIKRVPGTFGDPVRVVQSLPGAARSPLGTGLLIIRGSNPQDSGVYVDGIRIPYIYHLGGIESVINPDLVGAVDYLPGGFGARYGRSLGGVVDVRTRDEFPERTKVVWSTDALDSGFVVMGSAGKEKQHGFGVAARRSYVDVLLPLFVEDTGFVVKPRWFDYQAKYRWQGKGDGELSVLVFGFQDTLTASTPPGYAQGTDADAQGDLGTAYSTHRVLVTWEHPLAADWAVRVVPSFGNDAASFTLGNAWRMEQSQWIAELRAEAPWKPTDRLTVTPGVDFIGGIADFAFELPFDPSAFAETDPLAEREPYRVEDTASGWGPDLYLFAEWRPLEDPDALLIAPGLRFDVVVIPEEYTITTLDPRLSARGRLLPHTWLKGSLGLYNQPPQQYQSYRSDDQPIELGPERALSATVGAEQELGPAIRVEAEVFYKAMDELIIGNPEFDSMDDQFFVNSGVGRAYGLEVIARHEPVGNFFGWISYTLSRSERRDLPEDDWYPFDYDQTHILVAVAGYKLPYDFEVSAKGEYVTGNPTTPYAFGVYDVDQDYYQAFATGAYNSERLPAYWAMSARVDKLFTFRAWQLDLYVDLLNFVHGTNPEFEVYNYDYTEKAYISGLPFIPSPGFEAKFEF